MGSIVVQAFVSLDGVSQAPGATDEDREGGFAHGGWQFTFDDDLTDLLLDWESRTEALLLGRKTYDIWSRAWGVWDEDAAGLIGEFTRRYNRVTKHVASRTRATLAWQNSRVLGPDLVADVRRVRDETDGEVRVWGSTELVAVLAERDLVDEYRLLTYPIVLGSGKRLFSPGFPLTRLRLVDSTVHGRDVVGTTFRRAAVSPDSTPAQSS